jgi:hypothetical protein
MADKRRARYGAVGGNLTPQQAKKLLTLPLYAVITGQAHPEFIGSNLASPGRMVAIVPNGERCASLPNGRGMGTNIRINCKQWESAVLPVLRSQQFTPGSPSSTFVAPSNWTYYLEALGDAIAQSFSDAGYGPVDK